MSEQTRPQEIKKPKTVEVKTALPWAIIVVLAIAAASFVYGWTERSGQMITRSEVTAEVMKQLTVGDAAKKESK